MAEPISSTPSLSIGAPMMSMVAAQNLPAREPVRPAQAGPNAPAAHQAAPPSPGTPPALAGTAKAKHDQDQELTKAVRKLQDYVAPAQQVSMAVDHSNGDSYVKIVDAKTQRMILQIPSKEVRAMARKLHELADQGPTSGVLVDQEG